MLIKDWNNEHKTLFKSYEIELIVASAMEYQNISPSNTMVHNAIGCFKEIISFTDRSPVYPINWKYFNSDLDLEKFGNKVVMVDPANPSATLADRFTMKTLKQIRSMTDQALAFVSQRRFGAVFDPSNELPDFW